MSKKSNWRCIKRRNTKTKRRRQSSSIKLHAKIKELLGSKHKSQSLSLPKTRPKRKNKKKSSSLKFPSIPKTSIRSKSSSKKKKVSTCEQKLKHIRSQYKLGQKIMDEVDRFMGKK